MTVTAILSLACASLASGSDAGEFQSAYFHSPASYVTGQEPKYTSFGDINGDGVPDLVVSNKGNNVRIEGGESLSVLVNDGSGQFGTAVTFPAGNYPIGSIVADLDGDLDNDVVVGNVWAPSGGLGRDVRVFWNDGDGSFSGPTVLTGNRSPNVYLASDVNGDTFPDIVCTSRHDGSVGVFEGSGGGVFDEFVSVPTGDTTGPGGDTADVDGDGHYDLIIPDLSGPTESLTVLVNDGFGTFVVNQTIPLSPTEGGCHVASCDVNRDGTADFLLTRPSLGKVDVFLNDGAGQFSSETEIPVVGLPKHIEAGDVDGDGYEDAVVVDSINSMAHVLINDHAGGYVVAESFATHAQPSLYMWSGPDDFDGDGLLDIVLGTDRLDSDLIWVYLSSGNLDCRADVDGNGIADVNDISAVIFRLGLEPGDFGYEPSADADTDGSITASDISFVIFRLGTLCN